MDHQIWDEYAATHVHIYPPQSPSFVVTDAPAAGRRFLGWRIL